MRLANPSKFCTPTIRLTYCPHLVAALHLQEPLRFEIFAFYSTLYNERDSNYRCNTAIIRYTFICRIIFKIEAVLARTKNFHVPAISAREYFSYATVNFTHVHGENFMAIFTTLSMVIWFPTGTLEIFATLVYVFTMRMVIYVRHTEYGNNSQTIDFHTVF